MIKSMTQEARVFLESDPKFPLSLIKIVRNAVGETQFKSTLVCTSQLRSEPA